MSTTLQAPRLVRASRWKRLAWRHIPSIILPAPEWWVHHGAAGDSTLRTLWGYERYHVKTLGWRAPGYSFAICYENGEAVIYECRGWGGQGAHTSGRNGVSHGVVLVGNWSAGSVPEPMVHALAWLILHGDEQDYGPAEISGGHRQAPGAETACPGNAGMRAIDRARALIADSGPADPQPDDEDDELDEEEDMAVDVVEVGDEVHLIEHPWRIKVPDDAAQKDYWRDLARSDKNSQYRGPWPWTRERLERHPKVPWA